MAQSKQPERATGQAEVPPPLPKLNLRETKFVAHYSVHCNGAAAVRYAGYRAREPFKYAHEMLCKERIQLHVAGVRKQIGELHFDLANRALTKLRAMMEADSTEILDADGNVKDPKEWPDDCKLLLAGIDIEERMVGEGDAQEMIRVKKVKLEAPKGIIDSILKATGHFVERTQFLGKDGNPVDPSAIAPIITVTVGENK